MEQGEGLYLLLLKDAAAAVVGSPSLAQALDATVELVAQRLGYDVCSLYLFDEGSGDLVLAATHGLRKESLGQVRMRPGEGLAGSVFENETSVFTSRAEEHPQFKFFPETGEEGFRTFGGVPLLRGGQCIGVLTVQTAREYVFQANEIIALEAIAGQVVGLIGVRRRLERPAPVAPRQAAPAQGMLVGMGTSPGVGLGGAMVVGVDPLRAPPPRRVFSDVGSELARFAEALAMATAEVSEQATRVERRRGPAAGAILRVQVAILQDASIASRVRRRIEDEVPAERAVHATFSECADELRALGPPVAEKADDFLDAGAHLLAALGVGGDDALEIARGVVVATFLTPAQTARLDPEAVLAVVTEHGSETSHASILARSLGIPAVVGVEDVCAKVAAGDRLLVDGDNGFVFLRPDAALEAEYGKRTQVAREARQRIQDELAARPPDAGVQGVKVWANVGLPGELAAAREQGATGIGLLRTEFFFLLQSDWPSVPDQVAYYREVLAQAPQGPVTIRLLDAGGDKRLPYMEDAGEPNPILGLRSVRLLLAHQELARDQIEAILRAAAAEDADVRILVPLVTAPWELDAVRGLVEEVSAHAGVPQRPLGMMVETPAVLFQLPELLRRVDFVSLGTNDLTQYVLAVDRDDERVRHYYSPLQPAVLGALDHLRRSLGDIDASVCGEMASDPLGALALLALGYRTLSVRPRAIPLIRCLTRCLDPAALAPLRERLLAAGSQRNAERELRVALRAAAPFLLG